MHRGESFGKARLALHDHAEQEKPAHTEPPREKEIQSVLKTAHVAPRNEMMGPKTAKRRSAFRRANRAMPRRRIDIAIEAIDYKNPDLLKKFVTESGKILPRRVTGMPAHLHRRITREIKRSRSVLLMK
jgi:small subunit ribosomal protein S18